MARLIALMALALLTACGGGGDSPQACSGAVKIQLFGDSTQAGWTAETGDIAADTPAEILQSLLQALYRQIVQEALVPAVLPLVRAKACTVSG